LLSLTCGWCESQRLSNKYREEFKDRDQITEDRIEQFIEQYLGEVKNGTWESGGWQDAYVTYSNTKVALNGYTSVVAREVGPETEKVYVNCFNPGFTKTNLNGYMGTNTVEQGAMTGVWLALHPPGGPHGKCFEQQNRGIAEW
jgi:carbonyl reductase 1